MSDVIKHPLKHVSADDIEGAIAFGLERLVDETLQVSISSLEFELIESPERLEEPYQPKNIKLSLKLEVFPRTVKNEKGWPIRWPKNSC